MQHTPLLTGGVELVVIRKHLLGQGSAQQQRMGLHSASGGGHVIQWENAGCCLCTGLQVPSPALVGRGEGG